MATLTPVIQDHITSLAGRHTKLAYSLSGGITQAAYSEVRG